MVTIKICKSAVKRMTCGNKKKKEIRGTVTTAFDIFVLSLSLCLIFSSCFLLFGFVLEFLSNQWPQVLFYFPTVFTLASLPHEVYTKSSVG